MSESVDSVRRHTLAESYLKVLIADDDAATRKLVARFLQNAGIPSLEASNGEEALELARSECDRIGVILLDVMMPKMDGFEVLQYLKKEGRAAHIPVILLTAHANEENDVVRGLEIGADDHLEKPFRGAVLVAKVRALSNRRKEAMDLSERLKVAESMATTDPLTALGNRRHFQNQMALQEAFTTRHREPLSLLMLDLDHFKSVNDTYGHPEGDRVICYAAECIREGLRLTDQGFRLGGEEFAVLLRGSDRAGGLLVASRLVNVLAKNEFEFSGGQKRLITVSVGVASADAENDYNVENLVERADRALYRAKHGGRNRAELETLE
jgi:diguanylate cyclase (GGDEF)-like protein